MPTFEEVRLSAGVSGQVRDLFRAQIAYKFDLIERTDPIAAAQWPIPDQNVAPVRPLGLNNDHGDRWTTTLFMQTGAMWKADVDGFRWAFHIVNCPSIAYVLFNCGSSFNAGR
jgi:hypothetical protein